MNREVIATSGGASEGRCCGCRRGLCGLVTCSICFLTTCVLLGTGLFWFVLGLGGSFGPRFEVKIRESAVQALQSGDYASLERVHNRQLWLGQTVAIVGNVDTGPLGGFVNQRGNLVTLNRKIPVASASKWVSATVVYCVIQNGTAGITPWTKPGEIFPWWNCTEPSDPRCTEITIEKLLAFRHGFKDDECTDDSSLNTWEDCAREIFQNDYDPARFDKFEYGDIGHLISGLMTLRAVQKIPGYENAKWDDLMEECIIQPSGIVDAPTWESVFENGRFTYDYIFRDPSLPYDPDFPGLSGSLSCSPAQYANFTHAFLAGNLVNDTWKAEMTRSHGSTDGFAFGLPSFQAYAQGMWFMGEGRTHSAGIFGTFPWLDQSSPNTSEHFFGVLAMQNKAHWEQRLRAGIAGVMLPLILIGIGFYAILLFQVEVRTPEWLTGESKVLISGKFVTKDREL